MLFLPQLYISFMVSEMIKRKHASLSCISLALLTTAGGIILTVFLYLTHLLTFEGIPIFKKQQQ